MTISSIVAAQTYSKADISDALLAYEAAFSDFKYSYISNMPGRENDADPRITSGLYAQSNDSGSVLFDIKPCELDGKEIKVIENAGSLGAFDGKTTVSLDRDYASQDKNGLMRAVILPSYDERLFNSTKQLCPHNYVFWYGESFSKMILSDDVAIEGEEDVISDHKTIKLSGAVFNGKGKMTLWLCPEFNFLPVRAKFVRNNDNKVMIDYKLSNFVKIDNGLYFPQKITIHGWDPGYEGIMTMEDMSTKPLPKDFFHPEIPPNTHVTDHLLKVSYTTSDAADMGLESAYEANHSETEDASANLKVSANAIKNYVSEANKDKEALVEPENNTKEVVVAKSTNQRSYILYIVLLVIIILFTILIIHLKKKA